MEETEAAEEPCKTDGERRREVREQERRRKQQLTAVAGPTVAVRL